ncbi:dTDP-4-dehydrorhamnose reductase [Corynebacterium kutscheri]|uniref:dTDP-4-dehydrorhamnose reductase n=1 Tax=Corynebacterium kutscheri TaxID=35755 RepID=A0A0F6TCM2_9CORY|nr:bifunctional dTDP-4-dehydrorhamnose 3,5-epimerase family protein/NAD(P)-dependent oxidoreductase [Corynebacterium kutscheri]AKE40451.1 dTDP-4-dehydrorhamnose reductase [Corynebacterium kutscheri]VEH10844.1 dTDP-4-keto-6-deoxyglucose-3, 5-epimerase and dTDP-6-deoxy-L-mannose-dehydrogenase [Corynebacterium kutscheri]
MRFSTPLAAHTTPIDGLRIIDLTVHGDNRGWFKENWHAEKQTALLPEDFRPVQNNISFNAAPGVTRGLHAEPWDKYISVASGRVFGVWCDLREGSPTFGAVYTHEITPSVAVFVPRGVANGFQALEETAYTYLVNDHWHPHASYSFVNLADPQLGINWPIPLSESELSEKDLKHPLLIDAIPVPPKKILITGGGGQLATALAEIFPTAEVCTREEFDITGDIASARRWRDYGLIINAAAYTAVDEAERGAVTAWNINATAVAKLAKIAEKYHITLVHVSSEYVFDGTRTHTEDEPPSPLNVYGQSKAAGDIAAATATKHYIIRTSWVVGNGHNFVKTMASLANRGITPTVVDDQVGRLTFACDLAKAIKWVVEKQVPYGTYNFSNAGDVVSWADIADAVFRFFGKNTVMRSSTEEYFTDAHAPRPKNSTLSLDKITASGFSPRDWREGLNEYLKEL